MVCLACSLRPGPKFLTCLQIVEHGWKIFWGIWSKCLWSENIFRNLVQHFMGENYFQEFGPVFLWMETIFRMLVPFSSWVKHSFRKLVPFRHGWNICSGIWYLFFMGEKYFQDFGPTFLACQACRSAWHAVACQAARRACCMEVDTFRQSVKNA